MNVPDDYDGSMTHHIHLKAELCGGPHDGHRIIIGTERSDDFGLASVPGRIRVAHTAVGFEITREDLAIGLDVVGAEMDAVPQDIYDLVDPDIHGWPEDDRLRYVYQGVE